MKNICLVIPVLCCLLSLNQCSSSIEMKKSLSQKIEERGQPSVFQAWYGIDMKEFPVDNVENRLKVAAKHDLLWEEPLSQLGEKVPLVLGLEWEGKYDGLATSFNPEKLKRARLNKNRLLELNPNMIHLFEIRWRDAPSTFLPEDSDWWMRNDKGEIVKGWLGGWVPFYLLNYENEDFQDNVARQAALACESGVYDGVMLDWSGHLGIIKKVRNALGPEKLIIVNIHDDIEDGMKYKDYINGSFMELNPFDTLSLPVPGMEGQERELVNQRNWDRIREALKWFEANLQAPQINCLEVWGNRKDLRRMRATTTLGLVYSNGYQLYADPNPLVTPDHYHDWYPFWDTDLGKPLAEGTEEKDGTARRIYENGCVVYNHYGNGEVKVHFEKEMKRVSTGAVANEFILPDRDGDIFLNSK